MPNLKIYSEADLMAIEAPSLAAGSKEVIAMYARKNTVILQRCEGKDILESAIFGCECWKVFREWLENPMAEGKKWERMQLYRGKDE